MFRRTLPLDPIHLVTKRNKSSKKSMQLVKTLQGKKASFCIIIGDMNFPELSHIKVLVVDDDPAMTDLLRLLLQPALGLVITANSGVEGIKLVHEESRSHPAGFDDAGDGWLGGMQSGPLLQQDSNHHSFCHG